MKLLFFSPYFFPYLSGITTYPWQLLQRLAQSGYHISVLTFRHDPDLPLKETRHNITIYRMPFLCRISKGFISLRSLFYFWKQVQSCDLVLLNQPNAEGLPLALLAKLKQVPVMSLFHCQVFLSNNWFEQIIEKLLFMAMRTQLLLSDKIVGYTQDYIASLNWPSRLVGKLVYTLPLVKEPVKDLVYYQNLRQRKQDQVWIGYAGRISREKGLLGLVSALKDLESSHPVCLVLAGPYGQEVVGEANYYQQLKRKLTSVGVDYIFLGRLSSTQLGSFYQLIDFLVLPSTNQTEAFGMVQVEAMLAGTPVIASDLPGVRVPVKLTGMGQVVEPGNVAQLANAVRFQLQRLKPDCAKAKKVRQIFDNQQVMKNWHEILGELSSKDS